MRTPPFPKNQEFRADGLVVKSIVAIDGPPVRFRVGAIRLRPYPGENTASRPISHSQAPESLVSIVVGDHTRILGAVIFLFRSQECS